MCVSLQTIDINLKENRTENSTDLFILSKKDAICSYHFVRLACFPPFAFPYSFSVSAPVPFPPMMFTLYMDTFNLFIHQFFPFSNTFFSSFSLFLFFQNKKWAYAKVHFIFLPLEMFNIIDGHMKVERFLNWSCGCDKCTNEMRWMFEFNLLFSHAFACTIDCAAAAASFPFPIS